jgi:hypothetical protein
MDLRRDRRLSSLISFLCVLSPCKYVAKEVFTFRVLRIRVSVAHWFYVDVMTEETR